MTYIIVDPGSCHDGDLKKAEALVNLAKNAGADAIKFQLLTDKETKGTNNILLPWDWFPDLMELGEMLNIEVFASVFDDKGIKFLNGCSCDSIKFAHSQQDLFLLNDNSINASNIYVSSNWHLPYEDCVNLWCVPQYPVPFELNFDYLFPNRYQGFSSHCMGGRQEIKAVEAGAKYLEFHTKGYWESECADAFFAKSPKQSEILINTIRGME